MRATFKLAAFVAFGSWLLQNSEHLIAWVPYYLAMFGLCMVGVAMTFQVLKELVRFLWKRDKAAAEQLMGMTGMGVAFCLAMALLVGVGYGWGKFYENRSEVVNSISPAAGHWLGIAEPHSKTIQKQK